jgi:hypothetical protein
MQSIEQEEAMSPTLTTDTNHPCRELATCESDWKELAGRENEGLEISLLWSKRTNAVKVAVSDVRLDERFEFDVAGADALAAFHHPFAFAAGRGICFGDELRLSTDLQPQG